VVTEAENRSRRKAGVTSFARHLRKGDNLAEAIIWNNLKARNLGGFKFVRQFPIGPYFADFVCREHKLVVEIDGSQHVESARDEKRDQFIVEAGYSVVRFWSGEAIRNS
jgi:very-short-patch-repair endonuclease